MFKKKETIVDTEIRNCYMCNQKSPHTKVKEINCDLYLDFLPKEYTLEYICQKYEMCPYCGYVKDNIEKIPTTEEKYHTNNSRSHQDYMYIFENKMPEQEKLLLLENICQERYSYLNGIKLDLAYYYEFKENTIKFKKYLTEHIRALEKKISIKRGKAGTITQDEFLKNTIEDYYILIDCYRRIGNFSKALENINKYENLKLDKQNKHYKALLSTQKKMCLKKNSNRK